MEKAEFWVDYSRSLKTLLEEVRVETGKAIKVLEK